MKPLFSYQWRATPPTLDPRVTVATLAVPTVTAIGTTPVIPRRTAVTASAQPLERHRARVNAFSAGWRYTRAHRQLWAACNEY